MNLLQTLHNKSLQLNNDDQLHKIIIHVIKVKLIYKEEGMENFNPEQKSSESPVTRVALFTPYYPPV